MADHPLIFADTMKGDEVKASLYKYDLKYNAIINSV